MAKKISEVREGQIWKEKAFTRKVRILSISRGRSKVFFQSVQRKTFGDTVAWVPLVVGFLGQNECPPDSMAMDQFLEEFRYDRKDNDNG